MSEHEKLRVLLPHWIEHNGEHAAEFRRWAEHAGTADGPSPADSILAAARLVEEANERLEEALELLGGPLEHHHPHGHAHD